MLIRSQKKGELVNAIAVYKQNMAFSKTRFISARYAGGTLLHDNGFIIGTYPDEETAQKEMDNITQFFRDNPSGIYQMQ